MKFGAYLKFGAWNLEFNELDIFSHGLWAGAAAKALNLKNKNKERKPLNLWLTAFFGVFPDLFAFIIPFIWLIGGLLLGQVHWSQIPRPDAGEPPPTDTIWVFQLAQNLYSLSHSAVIFTIAFVLAWFIFRRPLWEMSGWLLHILLDIPTHSYKFFPTPFLWPLSGVKFNGFSWAAPWFLILNYGALLIVYLILHRKGNQK